MKVSKRIPIIVYSLLGVLLLGALVALLVRLSVRRPSDSDAATSNGSILQSAPDVLEKGESIVLPVSLDYEIRIPFGEAKIRSAEGAPSVRVNGEQKIEVDIRQDGETCKVDFFAEHWLQFVGGFHTEIEIFLPKEKLDELEVTLSAGTLEIRGIQAREFDFTVSAGQGSVEECAFEEISAKVSAGEMLLEADPAVREIEAKVSAGSMDLSLPKSIPGFRLDYNVSAGDFENRTDFDIRGENGDFFIGKSGRGSYGNESCRIEVKVSAGDLRLKDY